MQHGITVLRLKQSTRTDSCYIRLNMPCQANNYTLQPFVLSKDVWHLRIKSRIAEALAYFDLLSPSV